MAELLQFTITGLAVGMVYALIALGFVLIWKSSSVANLALGQIVLLSSWFTYGMLVQAQLPPWLGFIMVVLFALFLVFTIESWPTLLKASLPSSGPGAWQRCRASSPARSSTLARQ